MKTLVKLLAVIVSMTFIFSCSKSEDSFQQQPEKNYEKAALPQVTGVKAKQNGGTIVVTWTAIAGYQYYVEAFYSMTGAKGSYIKYWPTNWFQSSPSLTMTPSGVAASDKHWKFNVCTYKGSAYGPWSDTVFCTFKP
jgi:hypothetical protein